MISHFPQCEDIDLFIAEASVTNFTNKNNALLGFFGGELCNRAAEFVPETAIFAVWGEPPRRRRISSEKRTPILAARRARSVVLSPRVAK
jgi:hypothetical protein